MWGNLLVPQFAFGVGDSFFVVFRVKDDDAFDFDAKGEVERILHSSIVS